MLTILVIVNERDASVTKTASPIVEGRAGVFP